MARTIIYQQINKDHAYWTEKRKVGQIKGGHTAGVLTHIEEGNVVRNILFDAGLRTIDGLCDLGTFSWEDHLDVFITHGHIDHHAELMLVAELWCKREAPEKRGPLAVYCTGTTKEPYGGTIRQLRSCHRYGFGSGGTLSHVPLSENCPTQCGIFRVHAVNVDHFAGVVIYAVEFGEHKILVGWDMKTLPDPDARPILKRSSLALVEANTWTPLSATTGHTSVEELIGTRFLEKLEPAIDGENHYGVYLVHFGGGEDPGGVIADSDLEFRFRKEYPDLSRFVGVARPGQQWKFDG